MPHVLTLSLSDDGQLSVVEGEEEEEEEKEVRC